MRTANIVAEALPDWTLERVEDNEAALELLRSHHFDLVLTGDETSGQQDLELLRDVWRVRPHLRLIILTNESTPADVLESMKQRALLAKSLVDDLIYNEKGNEVLLIKYLGRT